MIKAAANDNHAFASFLKQDSAANQASDATNTTAYILAVLEWLQATNPSLQSCASHTMPVVGTTTSVEFSVCDYLANVNGATVMFRVAARAMGTHRFAVTYHAAPSQFPPPDWGTLIANLGLVAG